MGCEHGSCGGGSRRQFLKTAAATPVVLAGAEAISRADELPESPVPTVTLGKTGQKVTKLGMGTSWALQPQFVQQALHAGVRYIDSSESYERGRCEQVLGQVLERTGWRKQVYLVSKTTALRSAGGDQTARVIEDHLNKSLERLRTDYLDAFYIHGIEGRLIGLLTDPVVKATFEKLKKAGKIRFCGFSCHDRQLPELLTKGAEVGWLDQVMIKYNFRDVNHDALQRAIDAASKANLGLVAMKTQGGAMNFPDRLNGLIAKGFKKEVAAIKSVWMDDRMQVVVSEMTNRDELKDNLGGSLEPLSKKEAALLEEHRQKTANLYCHGCGHLCETAAKGVPVATVLRYYRYYACYGKREEARALYQALPPETRNLAEADLAAAQKACPFGLPVVDLVTQADRRMG